jgi:hypothetical protein
MRVINNALGQTTSVSSATYIDVLKYVGTALAAIAAIMRAIPQVSNYLSRRKTTVYQTYRLRIFQMDKPVPWQNFKEHPKKWASESYRRRYFGAYRIVYGIFALATAGFFIALINDARSSSQSPSDSISLYIAIAFFGFVSIIFTKWFFDYGGKKYKQWSARKSETTFTVVGSKEDVLQHCCVALNSIGATIVKFDETQGSNCSI